MTAIPLCLGCDPGQSGGLALVYSDGTAEVHKMPETERDLWDLARELADRWGGDAPCDFAPRAMIEKVHAMPKQGVSSTFTFGVGYGGLRMALIAAHFRLDEVSPVKWQTAMGCRTKGDKNVTKRAAQQRFPGVKVTHAVADALLIAAYGAKATL